MSILAVANINAKSRSEMIREDLSKLGISQEIIVKTIELDKEIPNVVSEPDRGKIENMALEIEKLLKRNVEIEEFCEALGIIYEPVVIGEKAFEDAPSTDRYPETIYYRLLAHEYLPKNLDRILYLDADILCLNDICPLYKLEMGNALYAAASHGSDDNMTDLVNKLRLQNFEAESYYNSGVLLMNLTAIRQKVKRDAILDYIAQNRFKLFYQTKMY